MAQGNANLEKLLGLEGSDFIVQDVEIFETKIIYHIRHRDKPGYICPRCKTLHHAKHSEKVIKLLDYPMGPKQVIWLVRRVKVLCHCKLSPVVEELKFRSEKHRMTVRFERYVEQVLCSKMFTVADVCRLFYLDYGVVYKIDHDVLKRLWSETILPQPKRIAVDEKCFRKSRQYVTIVTDIDLGLAIWVAPGNSKESLDSFFEAIGPEACGKIEVIAKDLHNPYIASCKQYAPQAMEVADPFHVVQRLNEAIDECRKSVSVGSILKIGKYNFAKGIDWLLKFKNENLRSHQRAKLDLLAEANQPLYLAYLLKESFFEVFSFNKSEMPEAKSFIKDWCNDVYMQKLEPLHAFADYVRRHEERILNAVKTKLSSAISEGINSKISIIKSMARGYRCLEYFMLKILQRCGILGQKLANSESISHPKS